MRSKFNIGALFILAALLLSGGTVVWWLYKLQQAAEGAALVELQRCVSTIVIGVGIMAAMLVMLMLFFNLYYARPVRRMNRALKQYLTAHTPFNPSFEGGDELREMRDMVERLVEQNKRANRD